MKSPNFISPLLGILFLVLSCPVLLVISLCNLIFNGRPILYLQERTGKGKNRFIIYKFRTMVAGAEKKQDKYRKYNEADGPVFKIYNDPRLTPFGKFLFQTGLDELPQLLNIVKGEMAFVGPRPLPVIEAKKVPEKYSARFSVLPGITSPWVVEGNHAMSFKKWMELDVDYAVTKNVGYDLKIAWKTVMVVGKYLIRQIS